MASRAGEIARVAAELEEMLSALRASVDALNSVIAGDGGRRDG